MIEFKDVFKGIDTIILVVDAAQVKTDSIGDDIVYCSYTDKQLRSLSEFEVHHICCKKVLKRIYNLAPEKLTPTQCATISDLLAQKYSLTANDKTYVINKLKACNKIEILFNTGKTEQFYRDFDLTPNDVLQIIHALRVEDIDCFTKSYSTENFGNDLIVFYPKCTFVLDNGKEISDIEVYLKLDFSNTTTKGNTAVIMSMHIPDIYKNAERKKDIENGKTYPVRRLKT